MLFYLNKEHIKVILTVRSTEEEGLKGVVSRLIKDISNPILLPHSISSSQNVIEITFPYKVAMSNIALQGLQCLLIRIKDKYRPELFRFLFPGKVQLFTFNQEPGISLDEVLLVFDLFLSTELAVGFVDCLKAFVSCLVSTHFKGFLRGHSLDFTSTEKVNKLMVTVSVVSEGFEGSEGFEEALLGFQSALMGII